MSPPDKGASMWLATADFMASTNRAWFLSNVFRRARMDNPSDVDTVAANIAKYTSNTENPEKLRRSQGSRRSLTEGVRRDRSAPRVADAGMRLYILQPKV